MIQKFNKITGHLHTCHFTIAPPNKPTNGRRLACANNCANQLSRQSCGINRCSRHWVQYCMERGWDSDLSYCLNIRCDWMEISLKERVEINPQNVKNLFDMDFNSAHRHLSENRCKVIETMSDSNADESSESLESSESTESLSYVDDDQMMNTIYNMKYNNESGADSSENKDESENESDNM